MVLMGGHEGGYVHVLDPGTKKASAGWGRHHDLGSHHGKHCYWSCSCAQRGYNRQQSVSTQQTLTYAYMSTPFIQLYHATL